MNLFKKKWFWIIAVILVVIIIVFASVSSKEDVNYVTDETVSLDEGLFKEMYRPKTIPFVY